MAGHGRFGVEAWHRRADGLADFALGRPRRILALTGILFVIAAPLGLSSFTALDPYEFVDPGTESARAIERLEAASGLRADGTAIALVDVAPETEEGKRRIAEVAKAIESVEGVAPLSETPGLPGGILPAPDGDRVYLVAAVDADLESADITNGLESSAR